MTALRLVLVAALLAPAFVYAQSEEEAGDISEVDKDRLGPLRERIRPVSGHLFRKAGRFEFSPSATLSFKDAFFSKYILGASLTYHLSDEFAIGGRAGYGINAVSGSAQICNTLATGQRECRSPTFDEVDGDAPGQIKLVGGLDLQWSPIYAKVAVVSEGFLSFDLYGIVGGAFVQYGGTALAAGGPSVTSTGFGGNVGIGGRIFLNRWLTVRSEFRDLIYLEKVAGDNTLRNQLLFELGFSMFFPTSFGEG